jgi:hypothetical protein
MRTVSLWYWVSRSLRTMSKLASKAALFCEVQGAKPDAIRIYVMRA